MVVVLVDNHIEAGATVDSDGHFTCELPAMDGAWHRVTAAHVESGIVGVAGEGSYVLTAECSNERACDGGRRCDLETSTCVAR
jgi:hypothetical protein